MSRLRSPSPALVIACLALAVALGGTGYAAVVLPANSVGTKQLKAGAVVGAKVKPHSLLAMNFRGGELPTGPQGPAGSAGPTGLTGAAGTPAFKSFATVLPKADGTASLGPTSGLAPNGIAVKADGAFQLAFAQDVSNCAVIATPGGKPSADPDLPTAGEVSAQTIGGGAVSVQTFDLTGTQTAIGSFTVAVFC
jgi:hypothetical protein